MKLDKDNGLYWIVISILCIFVGSCLIGFSRKAEAKPIYKDQRFELVDYGIVKDVDYTYILDKRTGALYLTSHVIGSVNTVIIKKGKWDGTYNQKTK